MKTPLLNRTTCAAVALTLAGLTGCATPPSTNTGWNVMFDKGSNLNDWTLLGDANWRIQDDAIQADFLRSKTASFLHRIDEVRRRGHDVPLHELP